jgi:hypothetical protein
MLEIFNEIPLNGKKGLPKPTHTPSESLFRVDYGEIYNLYENETNSPENEEVSSDEDNSTDW